MLSGMSMLHYLRLAERGAVAVCGGAAVHHGTQQYCVGETKGEAADALS